MPNATINTTTDKQNYNKQCNHMIQKLQTNPKMTLHIRYKISCRYCFKIYKDNHANKIKLNNTKITEILTALEKHENEINYNFDF